MSSPRSTSPANTGDFRLMDRRAADALRQHRERNRFVRGMVASLGFTQVGVAFDRDERSAGSTSYPLTKMVRLTAYGVTSFSTAPPPAHHPAGHRQRPALLHRNRLRHRAEGLLAADDGRWVDMARRR